jgi:cobalt-zinc-cadmium efflux system outer membrane protein
MLSVVLSLALGAAAQGAAAEPPPITVAQAVERAQRESLLRSSAEQMAEGADMAAQFAGRALNPFVSVRVENFGTRTPRVPAYDIFAELAQPLEVGSKRENRRDIAYADRDAANLVLRTVDRQIALDTVRAYMRAVRARDVLGTITAQRDTVGAIVQTMRRRVEEGFAPEADLLRFEAEAARMGAEVTRTEIDLTRALLDLGTLLGGSTSVQASQLVAPEPVPTPVVAEDELAAAIAVRPDVRLAVARGEQSQLLADLERLRRIPDPIVTGGYKRTNGQNTGLLGVTFTLPLFEQNAQGRARADAAARAASFDAAVTRARALADAKVSLAAASSLAASAQRMRAALAAPAEGVRTAARATFREGAADVLKLVDAERVYVDVQREALTLAADAFVAAIEARFAVGQEDIP